MAANNSQTDLYTAAVCHVKAHVQLAATARHAARAPRQTQRHLACSYRRRRRCRRRRRAGRGGDLAQTRAARNRRLGHGCHCCGRNNDSAGWGARGRLSDLPNGRIVKLQQWLSWDIAAAAQARAVHGRLLQPGVHTCVHKDDLMSMTGAWTEPVQQRHSSPEFSSISPTGVPVCKMRIAQLAKASHNQSVASLRKDMHTVAPARAAPATARASLCSVAAQHAYTSLLTATCAAARSAGTMRALLAADGCGTITAAEATPSQTAMPSTAQVDLLCSATQSIAMIKRRRC